MRTLWPADTSADMKLLLAPLFVLSLLDPILAQGPHSRELDFDHIQSLGKRTEGKVFRDRVDVVFKEDEHKAGFRINGEAGPEFYLLDLQTGERKPVAQNEVTWLNHRTARESRERKSRDGGPETVIEFVNQTAGPIELFWVDGQAERKSYGIMTPNEERSFSTYAGHLWLALDEHGNRIGRYMAEEGGSRAILKGDGPGTQRQPRGVAAAPRRWQVYVKENNVWAKDTQAGDDFPLTTEGSVINAFTGPIEWSPDGRHVAMFREEPAAEHLINYVESSPSDQVQPKLKTFSYPKPGDVIEHRRLALFDLETRKQLPVSDALFPTPWSLDHLRWAEDGKSFSVLYNQRGHQILRLLSVDAETGNVRTLAEEAPKTFVDYTNKVWHQFLPGGKDLLWMSERDGWNHLYLIDVATGQVKHQITKGNWLVRKVERVDVEKGQIWFSAGGIRPAQDPYYKHLCRVNIDGSGLVILTEGDGTHEYEFSESQKYFVDRWSRVDQPTVTEIRESETGKLISLLATGTMAKLLETGWQAPERFVAKGRDGVTDIYGNICRPMNFDPKKKYPVVEKIYAGPHGQFVLKEFNLSTHERELMEAGFILVQCDGMGTNWRSKAFHDVCWKNLQDAGFPDRIAWIKAAAAAHPEMDLKRVGIYGGSAGGQNAMRALLDHGDFYSAAVADCGCHDNRMDKIWWNEQWMGWPVGKEYEAASNVADAAKLRGHLFLTWGEQDTNVDPASSMQVVNALVKAGKDFDMFVVPGANHGIGESPLLHRKRMTFFARWLGGPQ